MDKTPVASLSVGERKTGDEKKYAIISRETIRMYAESIGCEHLSDEVVNLLSQDVTYRLREITQASCQYMRHSKRRKLTTEDFNKAMKSKDDEPVYGHGSTGSKPFQQILEKDFHFTEDVELDLAQVIEEEIPVNNPGQISVKAHWLAVEGVQKLSSIAQAKTGNGKAQKGLSEELLMYYDNMTKAILSNDKELMKIALEDLRTNNKIVPLLPYFVNFVSNGVKKVSHDIMQLTKLLHTIKSLMNNPSLYLEPKPYLNMLIQGVMYCVIEPLAASINPLNDHWKLRDYAARLLAHLTREWASSMNQLQYRNVQALKEVLYDSGRPFCSHYGAVIGLAALGQEAVRKVLLPHLPNYWCHIRAAMDDNTLNNAQIKSDAHKVYGTILLAVDNLLRTEIKDMEKSLQTTYSLIAGQKDGTVSSSSSDKLPVQESKVSSNDNEHFKKLYDLYIDMYEQFGDSLAVKLPLPHRVTNLAPKNKQKPVVVLYDELAAKSGEELLTELLNSEVEEQKSDHSHSNVEEIDIDSRSFKSDRSYRSDRSDEIPAFLADPSIDLTVKSTVNDPAGGIKLTISKRIKPVDDAKAKTDRKKRKTSRHFRVQDMFEKTTIKRRLCKIEISVPGGIVLRRMPDVRRFSFEPFMSSSHYEKVCLKTKFIGKRKASTKPKNRTHLLTGAIDMCL
ncbi:TAF6-like RNA polymerase II p300/CBP-associated factor-associated factor 65 kDa subunit 6L [Tubulanus polymorphus]|uniref:TAF6-like RNA polymerase II p300/CBP-associated factor-associated factor 65 kDa subunit 6L n=1 Tax=Tubulanus polymorphus TaxID=672921 RepID=UPI003DA54630